MICPNCETQCNDEYNFCPECGQKKENNILTFRQFLSNFLGDYFTFDSKIFRSLVPLIIKPGFLTQEYIAGRRQRYIPPLRMYIFISILFFLIFDLSSHKLAEVQEAASQLDKVLNKLDSPAYYSRLFFFLMPIFGFIVYAVYSRQHRYYSEMLIFSLHFHAFAFILFSLYFLISGFISAASNANEYFLTLFLGMLGLYLWIGLWRYFEQGFWRTTLKFTLITLLYVLTVVASTLLLALLLYKVIY